MAEAIVEAASGKKYDRVFTHLVKLEFEFGPKFNAGQPDYIGGASPADVQRMIDDALNDQRKFNQRRKRTRRK